MPLGISPVIGSRIETCAAVVQLEERFPAKEEVIGSNPIGYTIVDKSELQFATFGLLELFLGSVLEKKKRN